MPVIRPVIQLAIRRVTQLVIQPAIQLVLAEDRTNEIHQTKYEHT
jgi:hypothetical protein